MSKRRLKNCRPKKLFGSEEAAILAAAGITAASTAAGAALSAKSTRDAAKEQAKSIEQSAQINADALTKQNENNNQLQEKSIEFQRQENERQREYQQNIQTNLALLTGNESAKDRNAESRIQVKRGKSLKRMPSTGGFSITDGGSAEYRGSTNEGYNLYEFKGNDHEHYHKTKRGKYKSGVGVKLPSGKVIEAEGNQGSNQGEYMLETPTENLFISKHSIKGYNPAKDINQGEHPVKAFAKQEAIKDAYGLSDDGKETKSLKRKKALNGVGVTDNIIKNIDNTGDETIPFIAANSKLNQGDYMTTLKKANPAISNKLKYGGSRPKAANGTWDKIKPNKYNAGFYGAGINALGNIGGSIISSAATNSAAKILGDAYGKRASILSDAYGRLTGVDMNLIDRESFQSPHVMANVRSARVNVNPQLEEARRSRLRNKTAIDDNTTSSAARLSRMRKVDSDTNDKLSAIYANKANREEQIKQNNIQTINSIASANADRDVQASKDYTAARLDLAKYNNDINNQKIMGMAEANADAIGASASAFADARTANAQAWASTAQSIGNGFGTALNRWANEKIATDRTLASADTTSKFVWAMTNSDSPEAKKIAPSLISMLEKSIDPRDKEMANQLKGVFLGNNNAGVGSLNNVPSLLNKSGNLFNYTSPTNKPYSNNPYSTLKLKYATPNF